jgi:hypothetical protein
MTCIAEIRRNALRSLILPPRPLYRSEHPARTPWQRRIGR